MTTPQPRSLLRPAAAPSAAPAGPRRSRPTMGMDLRMSGLLFAALAVAVASLHSLLQGSDWWLASFGTMLLVFGAAAATRALLRPRWLPTVAATVVGTVVVTIGYASNTALFGVIPTFESLDRFGQLSTIAGADIAREAIPATATMGIQFLLVWLVALIAVVMDAAAIGLRSPALAGVPLIVVITVPSVVVSTLADPIFFEITAVIYLVMIRNRTRKVQPGVAIAVGAAAVIGAIIVPSVLPPVNPAEASGTGAGLIATSINPIINLGNDLRRTTPTRALTYTTTDSQGEYLRLTTLQDFEGREWEPVSTRRIPENTVSKIGAAPGLTPAIATNPITTSITTANISGRWLPVPYPASSITGLKGEWFWEPDALSVASDDADMRGQKYTVKSLDVAPTSTQLEAAPRSTDSPLAEVPQGLDPVVAATAKKVVGNAKTDFDKALALQDWFRGGDFTYSEQTPAAQGFDGSGLDVIVPFLQTKAGYCVHFATTMAVMARTLGIPSRIGVGFLPGTATQPDGDDGATVYTVTSNDLHAWPELYFSGVGWVRFEPTPSRGFEPDFPAAPTGDSTSSPTDPSNPSSTPAPTSTPNSRLPIADDQIPGSTGTLGSTAAGTVSWASIVAFLLLLVLLAPAVIRVVIRRRRIESVRDGKDSDGVAWLELLDSARDLGFDAPPSATPRDLVASLERQAKPVEKRDLEDGTVRMIGRPLDEKTLAALERVRATVEDESYAPPAYTFVGDTLSADLLVVLRGLRRSRSLAERARAFLVPATLVDWVMGRAAVRA